MSSCSGAPYAPSLITAATRPHLSEAPKTPRVEHRGPDLQWVLANQSPQALDLIVSNAGDVDVWIPAGAAVVSCGEGVTVRAGLTGFHLAPAEHRIIAGLVNEADSSMLELVLDPDNLVPESDETNNVTRINLVAGQPERPGVRLAQSLE